MELQLESLYLPEVLFVAEESSVRLLIDSIQPLLEAEICLETDYASAITRIQELRPVVVLMQNSIAGTACDDAAITAKKLLYGEAVPLVLLSDEPLQQRSIVPPFDSHFDLTLPPEELSAQIKRLLSTLPGISWRDRGSESLFMGRDELAETAGSPASRVAGTVPITWNDDDAWDAGEIAVSPLFSEPTDTAATAKGPNGAAAASALDQLYELPDLFCEPFVIEPAELTEEDSATQENALESDFAAILAKPLAEKRPEPKASPSRSAASSTDSGVETSSITPEPVSKPAHPAQETAIPADGGDSTLPPPRSTAREGMAVADPARAGSALAPPALQAEDAGRSYRGMLIGGLLLLVIIAGISGLVFFSEQLIKDNAKSLQNAAGAKPDPTPPATSTQAPLFLPQVAADPAYRASHPGWDRYQADALEYLVYRENGVIRAIQILAEEPGAISVPFFKTCIRVATGSEQYQVKNTEKRDGFSIVEGTLRNGGEVLAYRSISGDEIQGFVLTFPDVPTASAGTAGAAPK